MLGDGRTMRVGDVVWGGVDCTGFVDGSGDFEGRDAVTWWPGKVSQSVSEFWLIVINTLIFIVCGNRSYRVVVEKA